MPKNKKISKPKLLNKNLLVLLCGLVGSTLMLGSCNSGVSSSDVENKLTSNQLRGVGLDEIVKSKGFTFDLGKRDLLIDGGKFTYKIFYLDNATLPEIGSGNLDCTSARDCVIKIKDPEQLGLYGVAVYKDNKFVGAGNFNFTSTYDTRYYPVFAITPNSTGVFLFKLLSLKLSNPSERSVLSFNLVDERVRTAMGSVVDGYNIYDIGYYYFNFLLSNGSTFDAALESFGNSVTQGKIDPQFKPKKEALDYTDYINKYSELNRNAKLAKMSNDFNKISGQVSGVIGTAGSIIGTIYPPAEAASKGVTTGVDYIKQVFDIVSDMSGSTDALDELTRLSTNIRQQSAPDPDMKEIIQKISSQVDEIKLKTEAKIFWDNVVAIDQQSNVLSYQLRGTDVDDFIRIQTENEPREKIENLVKLYNQHNDNDGVFNGASLKSIYSSAAYISNEEHLRYLIKTIKDVGLGDSSEDNLIIRRKAVNDRLGVYYLDIVGALLKAYNMEKMAIYLTDQSKYSKYFSSKIALSEKISGSDGLERQKSLKALFEKRLGVVDSVFKSSVVDVYKDVPNFDKLYAQDCDIRGLNAKLNTLKAACPIVVSGGSSFRTSEVVFADKPDGTRTMCAKNTISANADGNLTCKLAEPSKNGVANIDGGNLFRYVVDNHTSDFSSGPLYDKSGFIVGVPEYATLTLNGNAANHDMMYVKSHAVNRFAEDGCENRFIFCTKYNYKQVASNKLPYDVLLMKNPKIEDGPRRNIVSVNPWQYVTADVTVHYNGTDYPFAIRYSARHYAGAKEYIMSSAIQLSCTSSYPTCEVVNNPDKRYVGAQRLRFAPKGDFATTIGIVWDNRGDELRVPRLVINP
ncbi:MAG: hypothetical protein PHC75_01550 [Burkholderiales bacterium]|nr:hypothetical protein [Burkholderiales bacterium]